MNICTACGGVLHHSGKNTAVCMKCGRSYLITFYEVREQYDRRTHDKRVRKMMVFSFLAMLFAWCESFPMMALFAILMVWQCAMLMQHPKPTTSAEAFQNAPRGDRLKSRADYIRALRDMPLGTMPLGVYGERAAMQIERMQKKELGLESVLDSKHPFMQQADEAEAYILENCKQVIFRLLHGDQNDPDLCRMHAEYLEQILNDNDKILRDYENLMIEVTQMNSDATRTAPALDVLADTLHDIQQKSSETARVSQTVLKGESE